MAKANSNFNKNLIWDEQAGKYRQPQNFVKDFHRDGKIWCPACRITIYKENDSHRLTYCDECGYDF